MIPRKEAKRLLSEYLARIAEAEEQQGVDLNGEELQAVADELIAESDLVLRGAENVEQKARRYLTEGRLQVERVQGALVVATCRGTDDVYRLGYDPRGRGEWRCTCPGPKTKRCSHLVALRLVVRHP